MESRKIGIGDRICKAEIEDMDVENKLSPRQRGGSWDELGD